MTRTQVHPARPIRCADAADPTGSLRPAGAHCPSRRARQAATQSPAEDTDVLKEAHGPPFYLPVETRSWVGCAVRTGTNLVCRWCARRTLPGVFFGMPGFAMQLRTYPLSKLLPIGYKCPPSDHTGGRPCRGKPFPPGVESHEVADLAPGRC